MARKKLPQSSNDGAITEKVSKKKGATPDPKQTSISSFFAPIQKKAIDNEDEGDNEDKENKTTITPPKPTSPQTKKNPAAAATSKRSPANKKVIVELSESESETESEPELDEDQDNKKVEKPIKSITKKPSSKKLPAKKQAAATKSSKSNNDSKSSDIDEDDQLKNSNNTDNNNNISPSKPTRLRLKKMELDFVASSSDDDNHKSDSDSDYEKPIKLTGNKRKKDESDFEPESESESSEALSSDHSVTEDEDESEDDKAKKKRGGKNNNNNRKKKDSISISSNEELESFAFKAPTKSKDDDSSSDITMNEEEVGEPIVIGTGRVVLPAGTPDFKSDPTAGKKLLKAHLEIQSKEEIKKQQQQNPSNGNGKKGSDDEAGDDEEEVKKPTGKKGAKSAAAAKTKYTPLEQQFMAIKKDNPDTLLMVECGYKFQFFGDDAEVANKVLNIYSYVKKNFLNASIPNVRLYFHLRRLVMAGYKVGIVEQTETAALKAISASKSQPFERKLTRVYTSSTFIDDDVEDDTCTNSSPQYLVSFYENQTKTEESAAINTISFVAVSIRTGEIIYDTFKDNIMRSELETILTHIKPSEILVPPTPSTTASTGANKTNIGLGYKFSNITSKCLKTYSKSNNVRTQSMDSIIYDYEYGLGKLVDFYEDCNLEDVLEHVKSIMNKEQIICLGILLSYLNQFIHFGSILKVPSNFKAFRVSNHLVLPHSTIVNLELLVNESDNTEKGSLIWLMNKTSTFSGSRLFTNWLCKPLNQIESIKERQDSVEELVNGIRNNSKSVASIISLFKSHIPDLQRNLSRIYYKIQCTPKDFLNTMSSLKRIVELFKDINSNNQFNTKLLNSIFKLQDDDQMNDSIGSTGDKLTNRINYFLLNINKDAAKDYSSVGCDKSNLWVDLEKYENIKETKEKIKGIENQLKSILKDIRSELKKPSLEYLHMSKLNIEYLVELPPSFKVPKSWIKVNSTQKLSRYHTPEILEQIKLLLQNRETLKLQSHETWLSFLGEFTLDYGLFSNFVHKISNLDCLFSLAKLSNFDGYVRPEFTDSSNGNGGIQIENGRHPVIETILGSNESYVPNSVELLDKGIKSMIITGPNMGGKSSLLRQTALIVIMAQVGCFVPATKCKLSVFDAIYTRMGARDSIGTGKSTFFIELQETSEILKYSTPNSLVILDELGRGTSTNDGVSIAYSTLKYIIEKMKCYCLFVTHYPLLSELELQYPDKVGNFHMGYIEEKVKKNKGDDGDDDNDSISSIPKVIFLYKLVSGVAANSYGLNIGRIANLPEYILIEASKKSDEMKESIIKRANLSNGTNNDTENQEQIKSIIKNWNSNRDRLTPNDLNQFIEKFKSIQLKL